MAAPPLRIVFSLMHAGYLRHYAEPLRILVERGHEVHLSIGQPDKEPVDRLLVERLLALDGRVTVRYGPTRSYLDGWRRIAWLVRGLTDLVRFADTRYDGAPTLRARVHAKVVGRVQASRMDPLSKRVVARAAARLAGAPSAEQVERYRAALIRLEQAIPPSSRHLSLLRKVEADVVLASPVVEVGSPQVEFVKAARELGIPSGVCIASWDNLTNKGLIRVVPDRVLVWNEYQRREAVEMHGVAAADVVVTGAQKFDEWFERAPSMPREEFAARAGLDPKRPFLLYLGSSPFIAPTEASFGRRWVAALRGSDAPELREVGILIRPHPQNGAQWRDFDGGENVVVWPPAGAQPDSGTARTDFFDSLSHAAAVVGINTSALIESGIVGRSVFTLLDPDFAGTQEGTLHFHYLLRENGGFLHVAHEVDEHLDQLASALRGDPADVEQTRAFVESFVRPQGLELPSAPIVASAIEELAALGPRPVTPLPLSARALRIALLPFVLGNALVATAALTVRRLRGVGSPDDEDAD